MRQAIVASKLFAAASAIAALLLMSISLAGAAEPTVTAQTRDVVLDYSWGYNTGLKQHLGSYKDGRSVHAISRFTRPNPNPNLPVGDANLGSPDFIVWVDETSGEASAHIHPAGVFGDGVNPGGNVVFSSFAGSGEQGRLWWVLGGRANELPLDIARSSGLFQPHHFDVVLDNFETVERSTTPALSVIGTTGLLAYRYLNSTNPNAAVLFNRYNLESGTPVLEVSKELGHGSFVSDLGNITIEQVWSRWDPRQGALAVTWQWFARQGTGTQQTKYFGSNPVIYTEDFGETWRFADGTPVTLPVTYAATVGSKVAPYDHLALRQNGGWFTRDVGFAADGTPWIVLPVGSAREIRFFFWQQTAWASQTLSTDLEGGDPIGCGATRDYLVCAFSEKKKPGQLLLRYSSDDGLNWSTPVNVDALGAAPGGSSQKIGWVSFVQPADGYSNNVARFFYGYYRTVDGSDGLNFKNNIRWVRTDIRDPNHGPIVTITSPVNGVTHVPGTAIVLSATTSGLDGDTVTVSWTANGSSIDSPWTPAPGTYSVVASATDGYGGSASDAVTSIVQFASISAPNVVGMTLGAASTTLTSAGLVVGNVSQQSSATVAVGDVISQNPLAGASVDAASAVDLVVSTGAAGFTLSPTSVPFGLQALNLASAENLVLLRNTGNIALPITSIGIAGTNPGQFSRTHNCGLSVPAGSTCTISVTFKPTGVGSKSATVAVAAGAGAGTKTASLTGTGVQSAFTVSPDTLEFGNVVRNVTSAAKSVTINNTGTVVLPVGTVALGGSNPGQFTRTNNCPALLPAGSSCTVSVAFKPTSMGNKMATLTITPGGGATAKAIALSGTGT